MKFYFLLKEINKLPNRVGKKWAWTELFQPEALSPL